MAQESSRPIFYYDLGSPFAYLAAERIEEVLGGAVAWTPVLLGGLFRLNDRSSWAVGDPARRASGMADVEGRAARRGLPPLRWPDPWPGDYLFAMRAATAAHAGGEEDGRRFALAAFRTAFVDGRDLSRRETVLDAAATAGLDRDAIAAAAGTPAVKERLRAVTQAAHEHGAFGVPTVAVGATLFWGDDRLEDAAHALSAAGG